VACEVVPMDPIGGFPWAGVLVAEGVGEVLEKGEDELDGDVDGREVLRPLQPPEPHRRVPPQRFQPPAEGGGLRG